MAGFRIQSRYDMVVFFDSLIVADIINNIRLFEIVSYKQTHTYHFISQREIKKKQNNLTDHKLMMIKRFSTVKEKKLIEHKTFSKTSPYNNLDFFLFLYFFLGFICFFFS